MGTKPYLVLPAALRRRNGECVLHASSTVESATAQIRDETSGHRPIGQPQSTYGDIEVRRMGL
jgi:hypothetical protein